MGNGTEHAKSLLATFAGLSSFADKTFLINSAYAAAHDLGYAFFTAAGNSSRHPAWMKLPASRHVLHACPGTAVLSLDSDAYVRALADRFCVDELIAGAPRAALAVAVDCAWFGAHSDTNKCANMTQHQAIFDKGDWKTVGAGAINTGVAVFLPGERCALPCLPLVLDRPTNQQPS